MGEPEKINLKRYFNKEELRFSIQFITPTFLGNADQDAEIRTPPIKNLIRRYWRIVNGNLSAEELLKKENKIFGTASKHSSCQSDLVIKILGIRPSYYVSKTNIELEDYSTDVNYASYLGFGLYDINHGKLRRNYIKSDTEVDISLEVSSKYKNEIIEALLLIDIFGLIGARSRKGFGSIRISKKENFKLNICNPFTLNNCNETSFENVLKNNKCYPHCLGYDKKSFLGWKTKNYTNYEDALTELGKVYKDITSHITYLYSGNPNFKIRKILGSPVKVEDGALKSITSNMDKRKKDEFNKSLNDRMPSQLFYKIAKSKDSITKKVCFYGFIYHLPYAIPNWKKEDGNQIELWKEVHSFLDNTKSLTRFFS